MDPARVAREHGIHVRFGELIDAGCTRPEIEAALAAGSLVRLSQGLYSAQAPLTELAQEVAKRIGGALCGPSAARAHGFPLLRQPERPWVAVDPKRRRVRAENARIAYATVAGELQPPLDCVLMCARLLPWPEALAIADSALRRKAITGEMLVAAAAGVRGRGAARVRRVAAYASPLAATAEESGLRAHALDAGLQPQPQLEIDLGAFVVHPDLVDPIRRIVIELDPWSLHGQEVEVFERDVERYTLLVAQGWRVMRYLPRHVLQRDFVVSTLSALLPG